MSPLQLKPIHPVFGAEASGLDLTRPLAPEDVRAINAAMNEHAVLVFRGQPLTAQQQLDFAKHFGPLDIGLKRVFKRPERLEDERLIDISNVDAQGNVARRDSPKNLSNFANQLWHSDSSFMNPRAAYSMLHCVIKPSWGGNTEFADMRAAYDALDQATKDEIEDLVCEHSLIYSRGQLGFTDFTDAERHSMRPVLHRLVRMHPVTGRKSLLLSAHIGAIVGWPRPEAMAFIRDLMEHATQPEFVYAHRWTRHDLVIWDNRTTMHRVRRFDDLNIVRDMRRTTTMSEGPTVAQQAA